MRVFEGRAFRKLLIHEGRFSRNEISVFIKETPERRVPCAFHYVRFQNKTAISEPKSGLSPDTEHFNLIL